MRLLHLIASVNPAGGGPIEALVQSQAVWERMGHERTIASLDLPDDAWVAACPIPTVALGSRTVRRWRRWVPVLRYGFAPRLVPWLRRHASEFDAIVVNGIWNYTALAARLVLPFQPKPYYVFTHGMLDPWFRRAYPVKHWAKQAVWLACEGPLLRQAQAVLFTSEGERRKAEGGFVPYRLSGQIAGYGIADPPPRAQVPEAAFRSRVPSVGARPFLLFLGRIHPKKGCDLLLRAFAAEAQARSDLDVVIAGPDGGCRKVLMDLTERLGIVDRVHWPGPLHGSAKWGALHACAAFVLPSHGENFGLAVAEALACGKPVLITDKVDIHGTISAAGAGLVEPDTVAGASALLRRFLDLSPTAHAAMGRCARAYFQQTLQIDHTIGRTLAILEASRS